MDPVLNIRTKLKAVADAKIAVNAHRFFKESIACYGVKTPVVRALAKEAFKTIKQQPKEFVLEQCEKLWSSGIHEEGLVACFWSHAIAKHFTTEDFQILEKWVNIYVSNWALCDTFCNHTVGTFLKKFTGYLTQLKKWTLHPNRWMKRAAAVSLIVPAREGLFLKEILEIASKLLIDEDDLVQKGYGWLLKVAAEHHEKEVYAFVLQHKQEMPRTALRYAIENMSEEMRQKALSK